MRRAFGKIKNRRGFSLTELLAVVAILGIVTAATAVGIGSNARVYRTSVSISERQDLSITLSKAIMGELRYASDIENEGGRITYVSAVYGEGAYISDDGNGHITVGDTLLVGNGAYSNDSFSAAADVAFENGAFNVTLTVTERGADTRTVNFTVVPINQ